MIVSFPNSILSNSAACFFFQSLNPVFTARCYAERGIAMASCLSIRPFVCPSVCDVEVSWSYRLVFLENNFTDVSLTFSLSTDPNITDLLQRVLFGRTSWQQQLGSMLRYWDCWTSRLLSTASIAWFCCGDSAAFHVRTDGRRPSVDRVVPVASGGH